MWSVERLDARTLRGGADVDGRLEPNNLSIHPGYVARERVSALTPDECDGTATEPCPRHSRAEAGVISARQLDHRVQLAPRHLEVVAQRRVAPLPERPNGSEIATLK